jgi:hypothetical protein
MILRMINNSKEIMNKFQDNSNEQLDNTRKIMHNIKGIE